MHIDPLHHHHQQQYQHHSLHKCGRSNHFAGIENNYQTKNKFKQVSYFNVSFDAMHVCNILRCLNDIYLYFLAYSFFCLLLCVMKNKIENNIIKPMTLLLLLLFFLVYHTSCSYVHVISCMLLSLVSSILFCFILSLLTVETNE